MGKNIRTFIIISCNLFFILGFSLGFSQIKKTYSNGSYSLLIDEQTKIKKKQTNNSLIENFMFYDKEKFKFNIVIVKMIGANKKMNDLLTPEYKQTYLENCNCEIIDSKQVQYSNLKSFQFIIKKKESGKALLGYSDNIVKGNNLYTILSFIEENSFKFYENEYKMIMNGLIINN